MQYVRFLGFFLLIFAFLLPSCKKTPPIKHYPVQNPQGISFEADPEFVQSYQKHLITVAIERKKREAIESATSQSAVKIYDIQSIDKLKQVYTTNTGWEDRKYIPPPKSTTRKAVAYVGGIWNKAEKKLVDYTKAAAQKSKSSQNVAQIKKKTSSQTNNAIGDKDINNVIDNTNKNSAKKINSGVKPNNKEDKSLLSTNTKEKTKKLYTKASMEKQIAAVENKPSNYTNEKNNKSQGKSTEKELHTDAAKKTEQKAKTATLTALTSKMQKNKVQDSEKRNKNEITKNIPINKKPGEQPLSMQIAQDDTKKSFKPLKNTNIQKDNSNNKTNLKTSTQSLKPETAGDNKKNKDASKKADNVDELKSLTNNITSTHNQESFKQKINTLPQGAIGSQK